MSYVEGHVYLGAGEDEVEVGPIFPHLQCELTDPASVNSESWSTLPLLVIIYCNTKNWGSVFPPHISLSYSWTRVCSHCIIVISDTSNWATEPWWKACFLQGLYDPSRDIVTWLSKSFLKEYLLFCWFCFVSKQVLGARYICMGEE